MKFNFNNNILATHILNQLQLNESVFGEWTRTAPRQPSLGASCLWKGAWDSKNWPNSTDLLCFIFHFRGGLGALFGGTIPPKSPRGDGTGMGINCYEDERPISGEKSATTSVTTTLSPQHCHHNTVTTTLSPRHLSLQHCQSYEMFYTRLRNLIKSIETKMTPQAGGSAHMTQQHLPAVTLQQGSPNFLFEVNISTTVRGLCLRAHNSSRAGHNSHHRWCDYFGICCILLMQPLRWCCVDCVIHHERDVREE